MNEVSERYSQIIESEQAMVAWASQFSSLISAPCQIHLMGNLGAGKTTLVRGILAGLAYSGLVQSPTYTLIEPYETKLGTVYHMDLYRLGSGEELEYLGIRDIDGEKAICLIEWPEKGQGYLPPFDLEIHLEVQRHKRLLGMSSVSSKGSQMIQRLNQAGLQSND